MSTKEEGLFPQCKARTQLNAGETPDPREDLAELPMVRSMENKTQPYFLTGILSGQNYKVNRDNDLTSLNTFSFITRAE